VLLLGANAKADDCRRQRCAGRHGIGVGSHAVFAHFVVRPGAVIVTHCARPHCRLRADAVFPDVREGGVSGGALAPLSKATKMAVASASSMANIRQNMAAMPPAG